MNYLKNDWIKTQREILALSEWFFPGHWKMIAIIFALGAATQALKLGYTGLIYEIDAIQPAYAQSAVKEPQKPQENALNALIGTRMEEAIPFIERASQYYGVPQRLYLGIANAESSFNKFIGYNPFGIKPDGKIKLYDSWEQSINGFSQLIKYYYLDEGKMTCEQIHLKYVGYQDDNWIKNCKKFYDPIIEIVITEK